MERQLSIEKFELIPGRVEMAMQYVRHCQSLMVPDSCFGTPSPGRDLTPPERAAYMAALDALRLYFTAEMDFGGPPTRLPDIVEVSSTAEDGKKGGKKKRRD